MKSDQKLPKKFNQLSECGSLNNTDMLHNERIAVSIKGLDAFAKFIGKGLIANIWWHKKSEKWTGEVWVLGLLYGSFADENLQNLIDEINTECAANIEFYETDGVSPETVAYLAARYKRPEH